MHWPVLRGLQHPSLPHSTAYARTAIASATDTGAAHSNGPYAATDASAVSASQGAHTATHTRSW